MLTIENVTKRFGEIVALDRVSLSLARGEFFGLLGPNGAGKTTLMSLVAGLRAPDSGSISINGQRVGPNAMAPRHELGFVPQAIALYEELSAEENLRLFGKLYGLAGQELRARVDHGLHAAQLFERRQDKVQTYSGGMKRRINVVASILHRPALLLCDVQRTVGLAEQREFNRRLILNHLVGQGESAPEDAVRATMVVLANVFARGAGPASPRLAQRVVDALNARRHPQVRLLGSLGQADLAPMADLAHGLLGGNAVLRPGEGIALLNNNAFATGLAALAVADYERLLDASLVAGALDLEAFAANLSIVDPAVARARPYAGLAEAVHRWVGDVPAPVAN